MQAKPYTPLLTHVMYDIRGDTHIRDHQWPAEYWNKTIKIDEERNGRSKVGRYIRASKNMFEGRCKDFLTTLHKQTGNERKKNAAAVKSLKRKPTPNQKQVQKPSLANSVTPQRHSLKIPKRLLTSASFLDRQGMSVEEGWNRKGIQVARPNGCSDTFKSLPFVPWGNKAKDLPGYTFLNSCPLDNTLMVLTYLMETYSNIRSFFSRDDLPKPEAAAAVVECLHLAGKFKFNHAKKHWMLNVAKYDKFIKAEQQRLNTKDVVFDMWFSEYEMVGKPLNDILRVFEEVARCPDHTVSTPLATGHYWQTTTAKIVADMNGESKLRLCPYQGCTNRLVSQRLHYQQQYDPVPIVILSPTMDADNCDRGTKFDDVPLQINVRHNVYKLAAASLFQKHPNHYFAVFPWNGELQVYNSLTNEHMTSARVCPRHECVFIMVQISSTAVVMDN